MELVAEEEDGEETSQPVFSDTYTEEYGGETLFRTSYTETGAP